MRLEEKIVTNKICIYSVHITYMVTFTDVLFFSYRFELLSGALISSQMTLLIFHKADLLVKIFLSFIYPGMSSLYLHLRVSCVGWGRLVWYHFLSIPLVCHPTAFWTSYCLMRKQLLMLLRVPYTWFITSLLLLSRASLGLWLYCTKSMYLFKFSLFGVN